MLVLCLWYGSEQNEGSIFVGNDNAGVSIVWLIVFYIK